MVNARKRLYWILMEFGKCFEDIPDDMSDENEKMLNNLFDSTITEIENMFPKDNLQQKMNLRTPPTWMDIFKRIVD